MFDSSQFVINALLEGGRITEADIERARSLLEGPDGDLLETLVRSQTVQPRDVAIARATVCEYPYVDLNAFRIDIRNSRLLSQRVAERLVAFPLFSLGSVITVAMEDPLNLQAIDQLTQELRCQIEPVLCESDQLRALIARAYTLSHASTGASAAEKQAESLTTGDEPVVAAVNQILYAAADAGASDIHINPDEGRMHLRFRVDGVLQSQQGPDLSMHAGIVQRLKVMANLDVTQTRRPQDGKFRFRRNNIAVDVRVSLLPTVSGENVVLRLLRPASQLGSVSDLGMPDYVTGDFNEVIRKPYGILLVTGPTGSGKTTTLYTALNEINAPERNIMTIEDPVEIRLPLIRQVQVNTEIGMTFAGSLRSILRQDPDVVLVGEIRDEETAKIAVQAALTGHLVFSTLHTNTAVGAVTRLRDLGVPPFAVTNAMLGAVAQRLVRRVCEHCTVSAEFRDEDIRAMGLEPDPNARYVKGKGCARCLSTGFQGRTGVYEMLTVRGDVRRAIELDEPESVVLEAARRAGMRSMVEHGYDRARLAITAPEELNRLLATMEAAKPALAA